MAINYTKTAWVNGTPPAINHTNLNKLEDAVKAAADACDSIIQDTGYKYPGDNTGQKIAAALTSAGYSVAPATGTASLDNIADGTSYKRLTSAEATQMRASPASPWSTPPTIYFKDALRAQIEFASGGQQTVLYDDVGIPSVMQWIPAFNLEDIHTDLGTGLHPAFIVNGTAKAGMWIGVYQAKVVSGRAYSWPGQDPTTSVTFDAAKGYCTAKGAGWHMMTAWEWAAVALWCLKNGFQPRGNTNYGRSHAATYETGTRVDGGIPGSSSGTPRIRTGSGPASWRHNNTYAGIADLVGNIAEWNDGFKIIDGRMYFPDDNNFNLAESSWPARAAYFDATVGPGDRAGSADSGDPVLSNVAPTKYSETPTPAGGGDTGDFDYASIGGESGWRSMTYTATYDSMELALRQKLAALMIAPKVSKDGSLVFATQGAVLVRNYGERFSFRGGYWDNGSDAGLAFLRLFYGRSGSGSAIGFRPAYIA